MTDPIPIQSLNHLSVANTLRLLLRQAEQGELDGFIYLASSRGDADDKIGMCGRYVDDIPAAIAVARDGFNCLLGHSICIEQQARSDLPRRIQKQSANDHVCHVASCSSRKRA